MNWKQQANWRHALWLALAVVVIGAVWLMQPAPAHVKRDQRKLAQRAPLCVSRCEDGTPCLRATRHPMRLCSSHRSVMYDLPNPKAAATAVPLAR